MEGWSNESMDGWADIDGWTKGWINDGWENRMMEEWLSGEWLDEYIDACIDR